MFTRCCVLLFVLTVSPSVNALEIYVDNLVGRDMDDGLTPAARDGNTGPVHSIRRALQIASYGDTVILRNTGAPYYESISLTGSRHSGNPYRPFVIQGNGSTVSGLRSVPPGSWRPDGPRIWKLTLTRKGYYQLLRNGRLLPESFLDGCCIDPRPLLEPGHWVAWKGSIYFRQDTVDTPEQQAFAFTADQTGISLHQVSNVLITDVTLQHFRFDGLHAQGLCDGVVLENVRAVQNGRAGIVASGASRIEIFGGRIADNRHHQLLVLDRSTAIPDGSDIQDSPRPVEPQ